MVKYLSIIFFLLSLLILSSVYIAPISFWPIGFISLLIPITIFFNFLLLFFFIVKRNFLLLLPLIILIVSSKFIFSTCSFHSTDNAQADLSVLSYNTSSFIKPNIYSDDFWPKSDELMAWCADFDSDIKCFQEFYNDNYSTNWNSIDKIISTKKYYYYFSSDSVNHTTGRLGVAIFSKYPIVKHGDILFSRNKFNRAAFADIVVKTDTVRVFNLHLQSMEIKRANLNNHSSLEDIISNFVFLYYRIKHGTIDRSEQTQMLLSLIEQSPYKVIVCGDFNETPYTYVYNAFNKKLDNAFEKAGKGFGFTYNGKTLFFLRIDNQFFGKGLHAIGFDTHYERDYSDHFPISAKYVFTK